MSAATDLGSYRLLASALAGRTMELGRHQERHGLTFTDGSVILVPAVRAPEDAWREIAVQACLIAGGALAAELLRKLRGRPRLAQRYLCLEAVRCVRARAALAPDLLLDMPAFRDAPGSSDGPEASWRSASSERPIPAPPSLFGVLLPSRVLREQRETLRASAAHQGTTSEPRARPALDPDQTEQSKILDALRSPLERTASLFGNLLDKILERGASGARAGGQGGSEQSVEGGVTPFSTPRAAVLASGRSVEDAPAFPHGAAQLYPEWDEGRQRYRQNFTCVAEVDPPAAAPLRPLPPEQRAATRKLTRRLARLCLEYEPRRHQIDGDALVLDDLVRLWTDVRAGHAGDERIYQRSLRTRRDIGVLVLLDMTGSSAEPGATGVPVFQVQAELARRLTQALYESGDRVALYGFHSWGRTLVRMQRIKAFDDRIDSATRARFARIVPVGYSRLGAAIRHGDHMLRTRAATSQRLLVLISDAIAYDRNYEGRYARADTRRALAEARAAGTACVCINVAGDLHDEALAETFGSSYLRASGAQPLDRPLARLFERAAREVNRRRYTPP